jgi:hypothetical protein
MVPMYVNAKYWWFWNILSQSYDSLIYSYNASVVVG